MSTRIVDRSQAEIAKVSAILGFYLFIGFLISIPIHSGLSVGFLTNPYFWGIWLCWVAILTVMYFGMKIAKERILEG